ncbi:Hsp20/alpha crystallin family protein [bacterium]|nr:MAG: Hsp20/alpha crystallin family protein [bacterium]
MRKRDLIRWDPFRDMLSIKEDFDRLFEDWFGRVSEREEMWYPLVDVKETENEIVVSAEVPGMKKEDIKVSLLGDQLIISGERKMEREEKNATYHRIERSYGKFERRITLPCEVEENKVKATYKDGVLTVTLPKSEKVKPREISVEVK